MPRYLLVAGIDFGTSFTKVVVRDNNQPGAQAVVITFPKASDGLLPSVLAISEGTILAPAGAVVPGTQVPYLKMLAAYVADGQSLDRTHIKLPSALAAFRGARSDRLIVCDLLAHFFARVMSATEAFIRTRSRWRDFDFQSAQGEDHLIFQIAIPTGLLDNTASCERLFREAAVAGHQLRRIVSPEMLDNHSFNGWSDQVTRVRENQTTWEAEYEWQCLLYPEVAAAVQTVFRAPNAQDGLYLTMDVGAGTVDLNAFQRHTPLMDGRRRGNAKLNYYSARVCPLGLHHLRDPQHAVTCRDESDLMIELKQEIQQLFRRALDYQPNHGLRPNRTWDGSSQYVCGGGAHHAGYRQTFVDALRDSGIAAPSAYFLPRALDVALPSGGTFGRFAVAYGLSFFLPNLDQVQLPHELLTFRELHPQLMDHPPREYGFDWHD
jgi:hypothetical protein